MNVEDKIYYIYAFICKGGFYYIGRTKNVLKRLKQHQSGGSKTVEWLKLHPIDNLIEVHPNKTAEHEDYYTERYMRKYGIDKVRGGSYVTVILPEYQRKTLEMKLRCVSDLCFKCGGNHYAKECVIIPSSQEEDKIIKVVESLNGVCGRNYIACVLSDEEVKAKHASLSVRGIGKDKSKGEWVSMIDNLISSGKLRIVHKGMYPMVALPANSKPTSSAAPTSNGGHATSSYSFFSMFGRFFGY